MLRIGYFIKRSPTLTWALLKQTRTITISASNISQHRLINCCHNSTNNNLSLMRITARHSESNAYDRVCVLDLILVDLDAFDRYDAAWALVVACLTLLRCQRGVRDRRARSC